MNDRTLLPALYLFTATTGLIDAVSFLALGHVFTANMTGNVVFLGFATAGAPSLSVPRSLAALVGFLIGALVGGRLAITKQSTPRWSASFFTETGLLLAATAAAIGYGPSGESLTSRVYAVIILTGLAMGVRNATVRKMAVPDLTTTVLTLTITGLAADSSLAGGTNPRWRRRVASVLLMFAGAAFGVVLLKHSLALPLGVATLSSLCAATILHVRQRDSTA